MLPEVDYYQIFGSKPPDDYTFLISKQKPKTLLSSMRKGSFYYCYNYKSFDSESNLKTLEQAISK